MASDKKPTKRRDELLAIERGVQEKWATQHVFEETASESDGKEKYFCTFPYPYMNGKLHLGHAFSATKAEFMARYQRMLGKRVLWPFAFHCTGMPIAACADKLKMEMEGISGTPAVETPIEPSHHEDVTKYTTRKSKAASKSTGAKRQWDIMKSMNIAESEIPKFADADHWLKYFPPIAKENLIRFGLAVDWRRSFITTDRNPYYDSFVRWQFNVLEDSRKVKFGLRPAVFSRREDQPCADHDRASGEGVCPQDYTLIKLRLKNPWDNLKNVVGDRVYLVAATLRPETMYGQTNCFILPGGTYVACLAFREPLMTVKEAAYLSDVSSTQTGGALRCLMSREAALEQCNQVFICSRRSALNMAHQGIVPLGSVGSDGMPDVHVLQEVSGLALLGTELSAPLSPHETVYALPMTTVSMDKGTGIVTSVPSDAPDDYAALRDLIDKEKIRSQFDVKDEWLLPCLQVIEIIDIPGLGRQAAVDAYNTKGIQSQNDLAKLAEAKEEVYKKGFYEGVMLVGKFTGTKVCEAKALVRKQLISTGKALGYAEPEKTVVSRSGDPCVVALCDQWFIDYGESEWKGRVVSHVNGGDFDASSERCLHQFNGVLDWLKEWACSRQYGLGTLLPWEEKQGRHVVIESLSDSTIYMAYYTVAHLLQGTADGSFPGLLGIPPEAMTHEVWNFIFCRTDEIPSSASISESHLNMMREEFKFWYPVDLRVSGKELIFNHLTFCLYNHAAIWPNQQDLWPRRFFCNGHVMVDAEKMSKQFGNFLTLDEAIEEFTADGTRVALADAGDSLDDANFQRDAANGAMMRLFLLKSFAEDMIGKLSSLRAGEKIAADIFFENEIFVLGRKTKESFERMQFRDALKFGFFDLSIARDRYRLMVGGSDTAMHAESIQTFIEWQLKLLNPIAPHVTDHLWCDTLKRPSLLCNEIWPEAPEAPCDIKSAKFHLVFEAAEDFRKMRDKSSREKGSKSADMSSTELKAVRCVVFVAREYLPWQQIVLSALQQVPLTDTMVPSETGWILTLRDTLHQSGAVSADKKSMNLALGFARHHMGQAAVRGTQALALRLPFDEATLLEENRNFLSRALEITDLQIVETSQSVPAAVTEALSAATSADQAERLVNARREAAAPSKPSALFF